MENISQLQVDIIKKRLPEDKRTPEIIKSYFTNKLKLDKDLEKLTDINKAAELLERHILNHSHIVIIGDRDADGLCATSLVYKGLIDVFKKDRNHVSVIINPRKEENGISEHCVGKLFELHKSKPVDLIISVDHGSRDEVRYKKIKEQIPNIKLLITDHHTVEYTDYPDSADVFINPQRTESTYYKDVSGCQVGLCLLVATYKKMYPENGLQVFNGLLPYAAVTVISDVMSLASPFNRYVVKTGLHEINKFTNPVWLTCKKLLGIPGNITTKDLGFKISSLINTANRTHREMLGFNFLTADDLETAKTLGSELLELNNTRKMVTRMAVRDADRQLDPTVHTNSIVTVIDTAYAVNGLVAAQLGDRYKRPSVCFIENGDILNGSCRGMLSGFNILKVLSRVAERHPTRVLKLGGHKGACGITITKDFLNDFKNEFDIEASKELANINVSDTIEIDAEVKKDDISPTLALAIAECGPYGKDWPDPILASVLEIHRCVVKGPYMSILFDNGLEGGCYIDKIQYDTSLLSRGTKVEVCYNLELESFNGMFNFNLNIIDLKIKG